MTWDDFLVLVNMGGYGRTVWTAYGCFVIVLCANWLGYRRLKRKSLFQVEP